MYIITLYLQHHYSATLNKQSWHEFNSYFGKAHTNSASRDKNILASMKKEIAIFCRFSNDCAEFCAAAEVT
jgi:hypothetical protein